VCGQPDDVAALTAADVEGGTRSQLGRFGYELRVRLAAQNLFRPGVALLPGCRLEQVGRLLAVAMFVPAHRLTLRECVVSSTSEE